MLGLLHHLRWDGRDWKVGLLIGQRCIRSRLSITCVHSSSLCTQIDTLVSELLISRCQNYGFFRLMLPYLSWLCKEWTSFLNASSVFLHVLVHINCWCRCGLILWQMSSHTWRIYILHISANYGGIILNRALWAMFFENWSTILSITAPA